MDITSEILNQDFVFTHCICEWLLDQVTQFNTVQSSVSVNV